MSSIRRIICKDSQTQSCHSTFDGFCKDSSRTIFRHFGDGSGSKSASLLSVSLPKDSDDLSNAPINVKPEGGDPGHMWGI